MVILLCLVVAGITANMFFFERQRLYRTASSRADIIIASIEFAIQESIRTSDEGILLGYLKHRMKVNPVIELAVVNFKGRTIAIGEPKSELYYRTIEVGESGEAITASGNAKPAASGAVSVELGFSKAVLEQLISQDHAALLSRLAAIGLAGLLLGIIGSWLISRKISGPIVTLAAAMRAAAEETASGRADGRGDEVQYLKAQYEAMSEKIRESAQFKEDLLLTLTHELNNPLAGIKGLLSVISDEKLRPGADKMRADCETMSSAVNIMELSLSNTLQMFRLKARPGLKIEEVVLNDLVDSVLRLMGPTAKMRGILVQREVPSDPVRIKGDQELLRRVVINLVSNACKYTPDGGVVRVRLDDSPDSVELSVSDNGVGIAPENREVLFTRFYRAADHGGKHERIPGSGLGLAIAKQAVDMYGGKIWVESEVGKGACFRVVLPKKRSAPAA